MIISFCKKIALTIFVTVSMVCYIQANVNVEITNRTNNTIINHNHSSESIILKESFFFTLHKKNLKNDNTKLSQYYLVVHNLNAQKVYITNILNATIVQNGVSFTFADLKPNAYINNYINKNISNAKNIKQQINTQADLNQQLLQKKENTITHTNTATQSTNTNIKSNTNTNELAQNNNCIFIYSIKLQDSETKSNKVLLKPKQIKLVTDQFVFKCLNLQQIQSLANAFNNLYAFYGYPTTKVAYPKQDISTGIITFLVVKNKINSIQPKNLTWYNKLPIYTAFFNLKNKILNINDIEQGLDQINQRLNTNEAFISINPTPNKKGYSDITIDIKRKFPLSATLNVNSITPQDKYASTSAGLRVEADSLLMLNDKIIYVTSYIPNKTSKNLKAPDYKYNLQNYVNFSVPLGYSLFSYGYLNTKSKAIGTAGPGAIDVTHTNQNTFSYNYLFYRKRYAKANFLVNFDYTKNITYVQLPSGYKIYPASTNLNGNLSRLSASVDYFNYYSKGYYYVKYTLTQGNKWFKASVANKSSDYKVNNQFYKHVIQGQTCYYTKWFNISYCTDATLQYSNVGLLNTDSINLKIQGFSNNFLNFYVNNGVLLNNTINVPIPYKLKNRWLSPFLSNLTAYATLKTAYGYKNGGKANFTGTPALLDAEINTVGVIGLQQNNKNFNYKLEIAMPVTSSRYRFLPAKNRQTEQHNLSYYAQFSIKLF